MRPHPSILNLKNRRRSTLSIAILALSSSLAMSAPEAEKQKKQPLKNAINKVQSKRPLNKTIQQSRPQKTQIRIKGLRDLSESKALLLLGNITDHIIANAPSASRADDVAFLLEQTLRKSGYPDAEVAWSLPSDHTSILLTVNQGPTRNMGAIEVTGVHEDLKPQISAYFKSQPSSLKFLSNDVVPFIPSNIDTAATNAATFLQSEGYWKATVEVSGKKFHNDTGLVDIQVKVHPGRLYLLGPIELQGTSPISLAPLRKLLANFREKPANTSNILEAHTIATQYFTKQGYALTSIEMDQKLVGKYAQLIFRISASQQYRIGKVTILGLERTDPMVLKRRFDRIIGRPYDPKKMVKNQKKLISTGAFESLTFDTQPNPDGTIDLTLHATEGQSKSVSGYAGAGSFEGFILGLGYHDNNFRGKLQSLSISTEFSGLGLLGRASITNPMFRGSDRSLTFSATLISHEFDGYLKYEAGLGTELVWTLSDRYNIRFYGDALIAFARSNGLPDYALGLQDYQVLRAGIAQTLDYRNDPLSPTKGFHGKLTLEAALASDSSIAIPYTRALLETSYRQPINKTQYLVFTGSMGAIFNDNPDAFPIDLRFFTGGPNSVRSFQRREMGPTANGNYRGGQAYWETSLEYNRQVTGPVWTNLFFDAGSLSVLTSELGSADINLAAGLGFWLDLPIGPVRAEYGYNLNRRKGEPVGSFHFTIGVSF